jgi:hypothetical protein
METKKYGLIIEPIKPEDYVFGAANEIGGAEIQPDADWTPFLPPGEEQFNPKFDSQACASFGTVNAIEILKRRLFGQTENYSDRFVAKGSGTTPTGNSPHTVAEFIRKTGMVLETDYPFTLDLDTWEKFYTDLPRNIVALAQGFTAEFDFFHEYVGTYPAALMNALKYGPIAISVFAWIRDENGFYYQPAGFQNNHWVVLVGFKEGQYWLVYDSYDIEERGEFLKKVRWDHPFAIAKRYSLTRKVIKDDPFKTFLAWLRTFFLREPAPVTPTPTPPPPPAPKRDLLGEFCLAIKDYEGWKPGSRSYRNNNPGNIRCSSVMNRRATGKDKDGFCIFPDEQTGMVALRELVQNAANGASGVYKPTDTIVDFFARYAPSTDNNNPKLYAAWVARRVDLPVTTQIKALLA